MKILIRLAGTATLLVLMISSLTGQDKAGQEELLSQIASSTCDCFAEKKVEDPTLSMEAALGTCMIGYVDERRGEYEALFGPLDYNDVAMMTRLGEKVGIKMMDFCPEAMMEIGRQQLDAAQEAPEEKHYFLSGRITEITGEEIATISMRELNGKPVNFYWLEYFPGSELLTRKEGVLTTPVEMEYVNVDLYDPATKEYMTRRKVVALRVLE